MHKIIKYITLSLTIFCISVIGRAQTPALFISDNQSIADTWRWMFSLEMGLTPQHASFCYDCKLKVNRGVSDDVARIIANTTLTDKTPRVILLQLGCNDSIDVSGSLQEYEHSLFDYPFGKVCTKSGTMARTKNIAVTKDLTKITNANFAGSLYRVVNHFRQYYLIVEYLFLLQITMVKQIKTLKWFSNATNRLNWLLKCCASLSSRMLMIC